MELFKPTVSAVGIIGLVSAACCNPSLPAQELSPPAVQAKLGPRLLQRLGELETNGQVDQKLNVLIRTVSEINSDQEAMLLKKGVTINSKLGSIASAVIPAGSVRDVSALEFVLRIELAKKLKKRED
jgi:hypothetical protein